MLRNDPKVERKKGSSLLAYRLSSVSTWRNVRCIFNCRLTWLKRKVAELGLKRCGQLETPLQQIVEAIKVFRFFIHVLTTIYPCPPSDELKTSNCLLGYRAMLRLLQTKCGYIAKRCEHPYMYCS